MVVNKKIEEAACVLRDDTCFLYNNRWLYVGVTTSNVTLRGDVLQSGLHCHLIKS